MNNANAVITLVIENKLRELYPERSDFQIRPLGRIVKNMMHQIDNTEVRISSILSRYEIHTDVEVERFKALMLAVRNEIMRLRGIINSGKVEINDFILVC